MPNDFSMELSYGNRRFKSAAVGLKFLAAELEKKPRKLVPILKTDLKRFLQTTATAMARKHGNPWPTGTTNNSLSRRSGKGVASILASPMVTGSRLGSVKGSIGGTGYLNIHEDGGRVSPASGKYHYIPLPDALNPDGTPKKASHTQWANTFMITSSNGNLLIVRKVGTQLEFLYVLKTSYYIRPRLGMGKSLASGMDYFIDEVIDSMAAELLDV